MAYADQPDATKALCETAMLWAIGNGNPYSVVEAAVDALVADIYTDTLGELAGASRATAGHKVPDLWPLVAEELGLPNPDPTSDEAYVLAAKGLVRSLAKAGTDHRRIAAQVRKTFGHGRPEPIARLIALDEEHSSDRDIASALHSLMQY